MAPSIDDPATPIGVERIRADGSPRISGIEAAFHDGLLWRPGEARRRFERR